ncbi:MAG: AAA family ATPase [Bacteroidales bacterium]|jgi:predicted AAA+ superfamily ATPase|nr:AAA family ATPase [Bacteroidales bacterium]
MFERNIQKELTRWSNDKYRKPLVLRGARQVGKTTVVSCFAKEFDNFLAVNLEKKQAKELFESSDDVKTLLPLLFLYCDVPQKEGKTLLFIDEIQNSPHTVSLLRYFYEELPEIYVIAAGSLLETILDKHISLPVGRVEYLALPPCSFLEFLNATGENRFVEPILNGTLPAIFHHPVMQLFKTFSLVGGMPEAVSRYAENRDIIGLKRVYNHLINTYKNDVEKYAGNKTQLEVIRYIIDYGWNFAGEAVTFGSFAGSSYKARETGEAFRTLQKAMLLELAYPITSAQMPVISELKRSPKLFWLDAGLVNFNAKIQKEYIVHSDLLDAWRGKASEQIVYQELKAISFDVGEKQNFWVRQQLGSNAEVDFTYVFDGQIIPVEVKSGHNAHLKSLHLFMDECPHDTAVRVWSQPFSVNKVKTQAGKEFNLINLPFYYVGQIEKIVSEKL